MIMLPDDWTFWKSMPMLEPEVIGFQDLILMEDICQIRSPGERFILDVGWYPDLNPKGSYACYLVEDKPELPEDKYHPWDDPIEKFETKKTSEVWQWLSKTVSAVHEKHFVEPPITLESWSFQHYEDAILKGCKSAEYAIVNRLSEKKEETLKQLFDRKHHKVLQFR